jgi:hypothetical protein
MADALGIPHDIPWNRVAFESLNDDTVLTLDDWTSAAWDSVMSTGWTSEYWAALARVGMKVSGDLFAAPDGKATWPAVVVTVRERLLDVFAASIGPKK